MAWIFYNPNPSKKLVGDCVIRAITKVTNSDWKSVYMGIAVQYLMSNGKMSQQQFQRCSQIAQAMGVKL